MELLRDGLLTLVLLVDLAAATIHKLEVKDDFRRLITLSTLGFYKGGILDVNLINFRAVPFDEKDVFGFTLDRTSNDFMVPYFDDKCPLQDSSSIKSIYDQRDEPAVIYFTFDLKHLQLKMNCSSNIHAVHIYKDSNAIKSARDKRGSLSSGLSDTALFPRKKRALLPFENKKLDRMKSGLNQETKTCLQTFPMTVKEIKGEKYYNTSFAMYVANEEEEGLYNLYFHNCPSYSRRVAVDFSMEIKINNYE